MMYGSLFLFFLLGLLQEGLQEVAAWYHDFAMMPPPEDPMMDTLMPEGRMGVK